ncbi:uncharacterized protein LOC108027517 [Drosophila biarmipes]|uniref:uncharacterized protein LOC108027517 n=1 Tax=Drosophila biarmipes TaxID=125945 RepID=UPI0007E65EFA|nr:uncharacterized protein LOC108027517 [Drosophila biarmipes]
MQPQRDMCKCLLNITRCVQQTCAYSTRRHFLAMQALNARRIRESNAPEKEVDATAGSDGRGIQAGDRLPTAVSLVRRNLPGSARNELNTAFHQYGKSMTDLAKSARKMYKTARLRSVAPQPSVMEKVNCLGLGPIKSQEQSTCAITERLTKLFFQDPWDFPKSGGSSK